MRPDGNGEFDEDYDLEALFDEEKAVLEWEQSTKQCAEWLKEDRCLLPLLNEDQINVLYQMALDISCAFKAANFTVWIDGGTLLGAYRHNGLIPWDDDLDFAMMRSSKKDFLSKVCPLLEKTGYAVCEWWFNGYRIFRKDGCPLEHAHSPPCNFPFADLFLMRTKDRSGESDVIYDNNRANAIWPSGLDLEDLMPIRDYDFGPIHLPGPRCPERHLTSLYGRDFNEAAYQSYDHNLGIFKRKTEVFPGTFLPALPTVMPQTVL